MARVWFNGGDIGKFILFIGLAAVVYMFHGWFKDVIKESLAGKYSKQVDVSFRMGMGWFILSEVMFFAAFLALYIMQEKFSIPWLSGEVMEVTTGHMSFYGQHFKLRGL